MPRVGGGVGFSEECCLGEVAETESILVLENVEVIVILVFENDRISYTNTGIFPHRNTINKYCCGKTRLEKKS